MKSIIGALLIVCTAFGTPAYAEDQLAYVSSLLKRASKALQEENYKGRFTYEFGSTLETLELVHAVRDGIEFERVSHLSGPAREFLRSGRELDCVSSGGFLLRGGLISSRDGIIGLAQNYRFFTQGSERVAGRDAILIKAIPKDEYRYGLTLAVDSESGLPLMTLTTASPKVSLERFQFVQIEVGGDISDQDLSPVDEKYKKLDGTVSPCSKNPIVESPWSATWLPPGFVLSQVSNDDRGGSILTYTDGIASFTLFISFVKQSGEIKQGVALRGPTVALLSTLAFNPSPVNVILIGEVPLITADKVTSSIQLGR